MKLQQSLKLNLSSIVKPDKKPKSARGHYSEVEGLKNNFKDNSSTQRYNIH